MIHWGMCNLRLGGYHDMLLIGTNAKGAVCGRWNADVLGDVSSSASSVVAVGICRPRQCTALPSECMCVE